jgi:predicted nucleic acid-binding protein
MIAVDTSSWIAYLGGDDAPDVKLVDRALDERQVCLPPVVLTELLSDPKLPKRAQALFLEVPLLDLSDAYWERAGALRAKLISKRRKAPLADILIAQSCIDHGVALVTRDSDFRGLAQVSALKVLG